jgi:hypothetical protein
MSGGGGGRIPRVDDVPENVRLLEAVLVLPHPQRRRASPVGSVPGTGMEEAQSGQS